MKDNAGWNMSLDDKMGRRGFLGKLGLLGAGALGVAVGVGAPGDKQAAQAATPPRNQPVATQMYKGAQVQNPGLYRFNGTLVDVTDQTTPLPGMNLTFISLQGVSYTVVSKSDGTFVKDIDTAVEDNGPMDARVGYRSLSTAYEGNVKHIRFEAPESAREAKVSIFDVLGRRIAEANYTLNGGGMFDVPWAPESDVVSGIYLAQIETKDNSGRTHYLKDIKISNRSGNGGRGFLINRGALSAGARPQNAKVVYDEGEKLARASGTEQWTFIVEDPTGQYVTHPKYILAQEGQNNLGLESMLPNDPVFLQQLDESFRSGGVIGRMDGKKDVYINTEAGHVAEQTKTKILDYLTIDSGGAHNGTLDSLTLGNQKYSVSDVKTGDTAGRPQFGADNSWLFDRIDSGAYFAIWTDGKGKITSAYVNLPSSSTDPIVLQEILSSTCGIDDYNQVPSAFNDPPTYSAPQLFDQKGFFYTFSRRPGTRGVGAQDDETAPGNLQKAGTPIFNPDDLKPEHRKVYDALCAKSVRAPDYFRVLN